MYIKDKSKTAPWDNFSEIISVVEELEKFYGRKCAFLDFEFNDSAEPTLNLVCCSLMYNKEVLEFWLENKNYKVLHDFLQKILKEDNPILLGFMTAAEARSILALGIDPLEFDWVDAYAERRQLTYNLEECEYGTYFTKNGFRRYSTPPSLNKQFNKGKDNNKTGNGLVDTVAQLFGVFIDSIHKNEMRDLIISKTEKGFNSLERKAIQGYCTSDILPLPHIVLKQKNILQRVTRMSNSEIIDAQLKRGRFMCHVANMEQVGLPINVEKAWNLRNNFEMARETIITDLVENHFPFYVRKQVGPKTKGSVGEWVETYSKFVEFMEIHHPEKLKSWPRTVNKDTGKETDRYSLEDAVLEKYDRIPEIYAFRQAKKMIKQLAWFKAPDETKKKKSGDFFDSVGSDGRVRTFLGAYGTQTSRNAPKASRFILAMSSWLRCLIEPPKGKAIVAIDYGSQEFAIAAALSGDRNMIQAYESGDPYLYFAKSAGSVPMDADGKKCKNPALALSEKPWEDFPHGVSSEKEEEIKKENPELFREYQEYKKYENQRNLAKSTVLGLQFGMGVVKLAVKLSADTRRHVSETEAQKLLNLHKKTFPVYWAWTDKIIKAYRREKSIILRDGWALLKDNPNDLSVKNVPVQGTGAVIMRDAVENAERMRIISPLHDALYCEVDEERADEQAEQLSKAMHKGVSNILGDVLTIRQDVDIHRRGDLWIEHKGKRLYNLLSKYLEKMETPEEEEENFIKKCCTAGE